MSPGQVLETLIRERSRLHEVVAEATRSMAQQSCPTQALCRCAADLGNAIMRYTDLEDQLLPAVLRELDAWGPHRIERMRHEHAHRREVLTRVLGAIEAERDDHDAVQYGLTELALEVAVALSVESEEVLREDLLRDDLTLMDSFCS